MRYNNTIIELKAYNYFTDRYMWGMECILKGHLTVNQKKVIQETYEYVIGNRKFGDPRFRYLSDRFNADKEVCDKVNDNKTMVEVHITNYANGIVGRELGMQRTAYEVYNECLKIWETIGG